MSDHPSTFKGEPSDGGTIEWDDHAELHRADETGGLLDSAMALRRGTFAEVIKFLLLLPEGERSDYAIHKAGDRSYSASEAQALAEKPDFPG